MKLAATDLATLSRLLDVALELAPDRQQAWLDALEPEHQALRPLLQKLLDEQDDPETQDLLAQMPQWAAHVAEQRLAPSHDLHADQLIGPYRLIEPLGHGGMGAVWLAERDDGTVRRTVALKLPFTGEQHRQLAERFERECAILATLEHRHIARLYDAGITADGQRYLALEHVAGVPITQYCDGARLTLRERVQLFLQVLQAVQYAHSRLVVHRDLKPSNIFVTHEGQVQLLDFGIATLLAKGTEGAEGAGGDSPGVAITEFGSSALTPDYASPEQVAGQSIGTASDVYSLGVVFYELLTGRRPYRLARDSRAALEEAILDADTLRPSRAVSGEEAAAARSSTLKQLKRQLRGDLDTIAMAALKKNQAERYASAESFHQDLQRWLDCERVQAHPDSLIYRARKFVRRNRLAVGAAVVASSALLVGLGTALSQARVARQQTVLAQRQAAKAHAVQDFLVGLFNAADPARAQGRELTVRDLMARGEQDLQTKLAAEPALHEALSGALVEIYFKLADDKRALALAESRRELALRVYGDRSLEFGDALLSLGKVQGRMAQYQMAVNSLAQAQTVLAAYPRERQHELLSIPRAIAISLASSNQTAKARELLLQALPKVQAAFGPQSWEVVEYRSTVAVTYAYEGDHQRATALYTELEPLLDAVHPENEFAALELRGDMGFSYFLIGKWELAAKALQRVIAGYDRLAGPQNSASIAALVLMGHVHADAGHYDLAATAVDTSIQRAIEFYGRDGDLAIQTRSTGIPVLLWLGRGAEAERTGRETIEAGQRSKTLAPEALRQMTRRFSMALIAVGKAGEALELLQRMAAQEPAQAEMEHAATLLCKAGALAALGRPREAAEAAHQAGNLWSKDGPIAQRTMLADARLTEALARAKMRDAATAQALASEAEAVLKQSLPADHPSFEKVQMARAAALRAAGRVKEADAQAKVARERFHARSGGTMSAEPVLFF